MTNTSPDDPQSGSSIATANPLRSNNLDNNLDDNLDNNSNNISNKNLFNTEQFNRDKEFLQKNKEGWIHGVKVPYSVFKYNKLQDPKNKKRISRGFDENIFAPQAVLAEVEHSVFDRSSSEPLSKTNSSELNTTDILRKDDGSNIFSGYYSIPKTSLNIPNCFRDDKHQDESMNEIPKLCYQNHYDLNDMTYTFGGLCESKYSNFKYLGIPRNVGLEKISVYFPCELPPFVSKDVFCNPFMNQNKHFFKFNPIRGTITCLDTICFKDYPGHINSLISCQISDRHIFFYGGFSIKVESVEYRPDIDRWIIKKKIYLNEDGYILDTLTLTFSKIELKTKGKDIVQIGRLGSAITASIYKPSKNNDSTARVPSPPIFTGPNSAKSNPMSPNLKPISSPRATHPDDIRLPDTTINLNSMDSITNNDSEIPTPASTVSSYSFSKSIQKSNTNQSFNDSSSRLVPTISNLKQISSNSTASKVSSVLSKSTRIFHRHQKNSSNSNSKSSNAHPLQNTYSKQVKQNRSNSQHSPTGSRPASPINLSAQSSHFKPALPKVDGKTDGNVGNESLDTETKLYSSSNTSSSSSTVGSNTSKATSCTNGNGTYKDTVRDYVTTTSLDQSKNIILNDSITKSGIVSVSIFVFGGFTCTEDENGFQKFIASQDLLKIDIACKEVSRGIHFHNEGILYPVNKGKECSITKDSHEWPSPRGFFAYALIDHTLNLEDNCHLKLYDSLPDRPLSPVSNDPSISFHNSSRENLDEQKSSENYLNGKVLVIQGGINENWETFSDFYLFTFNTGKWHTLSTYVHDYFNQPCQPYDDDDALQLTKDKALSDPKLIEAELRACHHTALYYKNEERDYLFFLGGFGNDYLRFFDKTPYKSGKFDVMRLAKFQFATNNNYLLRVAVLNLQTQTWRFLRYFYDVNHVISDSFLQRLVSNPSWTNARISNYGGTISLNGKSITICHGLAAAVPEKKENFEKLRKEVPSGILLWGAHVHFTFPSL